MSEMYEKDILKVSIYMIKDHLRILSLLHGFEMTLNEDPFNSIESFKILKWHLEKHQFVEERAIFNSARFDRSTEEYSLFFEIADQHRKIMNEMEAIFHNLQRDFGVDIVKLRDLLNSHLNFEERIAYPKLDKMITDSERKRIVYSLRDIIGDI